MVKENLEKSIRENYQLIEEYKSQIRQSTEPKERRRDQQRIDEQWEYIKEDFQEYEKLVPNHGEWPPDINEISRLLVEVPIPPHETPLSDKIEINVLTWNVAGAKMFNNLNYPPDNAALGYIEAYYNAWKQVVRDLLPKTSQGPKYPDIILLQECIGFKDKRTEPSGRWESGKRILQQIFRGYECFFFPALSSRIHPHPGKWQKFKLGNIRNFIPDYVEAQQGYGICIRDPSTLRKLWVDEEDQSQLSSHSDLPGSNFELCFEVINSAPGLYLGNRDTEPRLMVMGRMKIGSPKTVERYVNFVNVHLTTLKGEREGIKTKNDAARTIRLKQLDLLLNSTVSAYQEAEKYRIPRNSAREDIWILGGDFNAIPDSEEMNQLQKEYIDGNIDKRIMDNDASGIYSDLPGTKWSSKDSKKEPIVVDYILCGLKLTSFSPKQIDITESQRPLRPQFDNTDFTSDHAVLFASFKI